MIKRYFVISFILLFVSFYGSVTAQMNCDLSGFKTFTKGGWGSPASGNNPGRIRDSLFNQLFPQGLTTGGAKTIKITSSQMVENYLRSSGGTPYKLLYSYVNPEETESGNFGLQMVALTLNVAFDATLPKALLLSELVIKEGKFAGMSVAEFITLANAALGGADISSAFYTYSDLNDAAARINENFDNGTVNKGFLTCPDDHTPQKASIGDRVWNDRNNNGIQDLGEPGIPGVTVQLFKCTGDVFLADTTTDSLGFYHFNDLAPGDYYVKFILPAGYSFSPLKAGDDITMDSDAKPALGGRTDCYTLSAGENETSADAGMFKPLPHTANIGDYVWVDVNNNGIQDDGHTGVRGVKVELYNCNSTFIDSTRTDSLGLYFFTNVPAGSYYVKIIIPEGYTIGKKNQDSLDFADSDFNLNGQTDCFAFAGTKDDYTIDAALITPQGTDLEVVKTASKKHVQCEEVFSYLVILSNKGPLKATNIAVSDLLPKGADFVSASPSQGTYNSVTGEWTIPELNSGKSALLSISVRANCDELSSNLINLGAANGFNVFVLENMTQPSADAQGKVAVGGDATLSNYSVGDMLPPNSGDVLIVGGNLTYTSGRVYNGNVVYGGTTNLPQNGVSITDGTLRHGNPIDFSMAKAYLQNLSVVLSGYLANGITSLQWGALTLSGTDPVLNIFNVSGGSLSGINSFSLNVPAGSYALVNISGQNVSWMGGLSLSGVTASNVIYNFFQAQNLRIFGVDLRGTVLAPLAAVSFQSGIITGQLIAKSVAGPGQFNNCPWDGNIPGTKSFTNTASLSRSVPVDLNAGNNSSSVTVYIGIPDGVTEKDALPSDFSLMQNYPNPFNPSTAIRFTVPLAGRYTIKVFSMLGQEVATLLNRELQAGYHEVAFDASGLTSGVYIYRLSGRNGTLIKKMVLTK